MSNLKHNILDTKSIISNLSILSDKFKEPTSLVVEGSLTRSVGLTLEARGFRAPIGTVCHIKKSPGHEIEAVVTGFKGDVLYLMPTCDLHGIELGSKVYSTGQAISIPVGNDLLGRVIDGAGKALDSGPTLKLNERTDLYKDRVNPLLRAQITEPLDVGIRTINGLLTVGKGQRIGLFAGSGVGKSVLLGMISRFTKAEVIVVGLIGERGREVKEFIENNLGSSGMKRAVVVASPADYSPVLRFHGALATMSIAEYFMNQGKNVLVLMDSLTRFAQAQREISLAMGEPPATKGYPPSVFASLPQLVERAGMGINGKGSITGIFTVLAEGDDINDPIVDAARAILDGHIVMSRKIAELGHYPAIDVNNSVSRVMSAVATPEQIHRAKVFKRYISLYHENKDLVNIGAYNPGVNPELDFAVNNINTLNNFLQQSIEQKIDIQQAIDELGMALDNNQIATTE